jgi:nitroimidazol reductase NimA-like FMN-containing flavoprotein (pyridoxamine 5'-phosphate oxidase superfamily)
MFRDMRRNKQLLPADETIRMLETCTSGVLNVSGDDGYPYGVPVSYTYRDGKIYIHSARLGHKIDGINRSDKVSFCVIAEDSVQPATFTTHFRSVVAFGRARILEDAGERRAALQSLLEKYSPGYLDKGQEEIDSALDRVTLVEIAIEHVTGKAAIEIVNARK